MTCVLCRRKCSRCGYVWIKRTIAPKRCPSCGCKLSGRKK